MSQSASYWIKDDFDVAVNFIMQFLEALKLMILLIHTSAFLKDNEEIKIDTQTTEDTILDDDLKNSRFFQQSFQLSAISKQYSKFVNLHVSAVFEPCHKPDLLYNLDTHPLVAH